MATPPNQQDMDETADAGTMSDSQHFSDDLNYDPRAEDSQYHEVGSTHHVPTKSGEEDPMQVDSDRPGSAGTGRSVPLAEDDEQFLADMAPSSKQETESFVPQPVEAKIFARPGLPSEPDGAFGFSFGQFTQQKMDMVGTRKAPPSSMAVTRPEPTQLEVIRDPGDQDTQGNLLGQAAGETVLHEHHQPDAQPYQQQDTSQQVSNQRNIHQQDADQRPRRRPHANKGKGKNGKRRHTEPAIQPVEAAAVATTSTSVKTEASAEVSPHMDEGEEHFEDASDHFPQATDDQIRPTTPDAQVTQDYHQAQGSSPHSQLQEELGTALQQNDYLEETHEPEPNGTYDQPSVEPSLQPPTHFRTAQNFQHNDEAMPAVSHGHCQLAEATIPPRMKKASKKGTRKATTPARFVSDTTTTSDSDINDYMQILMFKIGEEGQKSVDRVSAERDAMQQELEQLNEAKHHLQGELNTVLQEHDDLILTCGKQKAKLTTYEAKVKKFKIFVDGLGHDVDSLKREANATRRKSEQLVHESQDRKAEREALLEQMNSCTERSSQLKNEALRACSETQSELQTAVLQAGYLDRQLSEKVGLLAEERDRRAQLERRLLSAADPSEGIVNAMKTNNEALLDKLHLVHATLESNVAKDKISGTLGRVLEAVQAGNSQATTNATDATLTKGLVEALNDRIVEMEEHATTQPLKTQLDEVLTELKGLADHQEDRVRQESAHREAMNGLQEKLKSSNVRIANAEGQLQIVQTRGKHLKEENQELQNKVVAVQSQPTSAGDAQRQRNDTNIELQSKIKALETAKSDLASKAAELEALKKTNEELESAMQRLRETVRELEQARTNLVPEKRAVEEQIRKEVERVRTESLKHSQDYRAQLEMESKNQLRKLTSDRDRDEKQVTPLKVELANTKKHVEELQKKVTISTATNEQLEHVKKQARSQVKEIEALKASLRDLQKSADIDASLKDKLSSLSNDLDAERVKLQGAVEGKKALLKKAEGYQRDTDDASKAFEEARAELTTYRADAEIQMKKLNEALKDAEEAKRRAEAGQEHFRTSCDAAIENEKINSRRNLEDLQTILSEREAELRKEREDAKGFRADVEKESQLCDIDHAQQLDYLREKIEKADSARDEALANSEQSIEERRTLLDQIDVLKRRLASTEEKPKNQQQSPPKAAEANSFLKVPSLSEGITPSASERSTEPTRPRKKVDRNHNSTVDTSALPVPEVLRPESARAGSSKGEQAARAGMVKDSQADETQWTEANPVEVTRNQSGDLLMFSDIDDGAPQIAQSFPSQQRTERVEETQIDSLPSFSAFNRTFSATQAPQLDQMSSSLSMTYDNHNQAAFDTAYRSGQALQRSSNVRQGDEYSLRQPDTTFTIYEDAGGVGDHTAKSLYDTPSVHAQDSFELSQEERDRYTFRKSMPKPNSASKLVRGDGQSTAGSNGSTWGSQQRQPLRERRLDTPEVRGEAVHSSQRSMGHSSSPAYVQPTASRPARTYSNTPGGSGRRQTSRTQHVAGQDPRLAGRNPPPAPKRKAETNIIEGYEHERKKRLSAAANAPSSGTPRLGLRSASQQSINDLPSFPAMPANPKGSSSQSRLRTLAGGSSRAPPSKKMSKADEFGARFSQELGRR